MIGISTKSIYALAALYELSKCDKDRPVKIKEIAKNAKIPQNFLEQILLDLKKAGLLNSTKGASGGYSLAKPAKDIMIADIVRVLENDYFKNDSKTGNHALKMMWDDIQDQVNELLQIPLTKIDEYQQKLNDSYIYNI
jgi:Rrf2 family protein